MENDKIENKTIIKRISVSLCLVAFCFALFGSLFSPIRKVNADQVIGGDNTLIVESDAYYRTFFPFDTISLYDIKVGSTVQGGLDFNYYDLNNSTVSTSPPTIPNYAIETTLRGYWDYLDFYNFVFFDKSISYYSDFNVECIDSYYMLGGLSYFPYENVDCQIPRLTYSLSKPILVDHSAGDTNFMIVSSNYTATEFCLKWTAKIVYTLVYVDSNGEQQTVNVTTSQATPFAIEVGQVYNIMPALPSNANLNYPYMLYDYRLVLTPFSPSGVVADLTKTYAIPLFCFDSYAYKTVDYRYLEYEFYESNITIVEPVDNWVESIKSFFFDSIHGFLSTEILPGITFYWILFVCVGVPILIAILKIWLGG